MVDEELELKIERLEIMAKRWRRLGMLYRKILHQGEASPKEEHEYGELAAYYTREYHALATRCDLKVPPESSLIQMVTDVSDARGIREMGDMQRRKFENDWRVNNTVMNQKLGELKLLQDELEDVSAFAYHMKRFFSNPVVQWTTGLSIVVILLGVFGVFWMLYDLVKQFIHSLQ